MTERRSSYDIPTAITFFLAGLGVGTLLVLTLSPRENGVPLTQTRSVAPTLERSRAL
jgi:hypothetical protein